MALSRVTVTWDVEDIAAAGTSGSVSFALSGVLVDTATGDVISPDPPHRYELTGTEGQSDPLIANDNPTLDPPGSYYVVTIATQRATVKYNVVISSAAGATQTLGSLIEGQVVPAQSMGGYLPMPAGTAAAGYVPVATGSGNGTRWQPQSGGGSGGVQLAGDLGGAVASPEVTGTHLASPLPVAQGGTGAASAGAALTVLGAASAQALTAEMSRAQAAEQENASAAAAAAATAAPPATPASVTAAVGAETSRAEAAEALLLPLRPWQFPVPAPSGGDDTAAVNAASQAAQAYAAAHGYAEVLFQAGVYSLSAPSGGTSGKCNALVPVDPVPVAQQKAVLALKGAGVQGALYHWQQTTPQLAGTVLRTTYAGGTTPTAGNEPSVIGGPVPHAGYGEASALFSNMHLVIDGIGVAVPQNPEVCGFDLRGIGEATVVSASALAVSTGTGAPARPDSGSGLWSWGLYMPQSNNNDICDIGSFSCEGFPVGLWVEEHVSAASVRTLNCYNGVQVQPQSGFPHGNRFGYISAENCFQPLMFTGGATAKADIGTLDIEWDGSTGGAIISATAGTKALGMVRVCANGSDGASLSAAMSSGINANSGISGLKVINSDMPTGPWDSAPAVPASGTAQLNTAWRDAVVWVRGGTVTGIAIDGTTLTGVTSGPVRVPSGHSITITYSAAPSWQWVLD